MNDHKEYYAFISYKREDKKKAKRLQHALEFYRLPNHLRQENMKLPRQISAQIKKFLISDESLRK